MFKLSENFINKYKRKKAPFGFNGLGELVYMRTYSRIKEDGKNERWWETVQRVVEGTYTMQMNHIEGHQLGWNPWQAQKSAQEMYDRIFNMKFLPPGRGLWAMGTAITEEKGLYAALNNCAFVSTKTLKEDYAKPFCFLMDASMLGVGVGFDTKGAGEIIVKGIDKNRETTYEIPDTREGWVESLRLLLESYFHNTPEVKFDYSKIRLAGEPIKGFGGVASGPEDLVWGMFEINKLLNSRSGKRLRPIDCLDIMNIIGRIVVAGNVRRSAQIAIGDYDDIEYLRAKRWDLGGIPNWRSMSNNSVACDDISLLPEEFWEGYKGNGEPYGLINLDAARRMGRTGELDYPDPEVMGFNPCAEQSLADHETCCLAEIYLPNIESYEELKKVATYLYRINKHSLAIKCAVKETEDIVHKNMRMGIGVTGYLQATDEQREWLSDCYMYLRAYDKEYSNQKGFNPSIKITTVKPSGTLSLLAGVTPGAHPGYSTYFIRRIRMASDSPIVDVCKNHGYDVEYQRNFDGTEDHSTVVVSFPCKFPDNTVVAADLSAVDQLNVIKKLQAEWSDNAVSVTIYYRLEELDAIKEWLSENYINVKSVSFLLHNDHGFDQAPYEEITKDVYDKMSSKVKLITNLEGQISLDDMDIADCEGGACPVR